MSIVISDDVILSAVGGADAPLIGYRTVTGAATVTATSAVDAQPITLALNKSTAEKWKASSVADQTIEVEPGSAVTLDYVGIAAHNLGTAGATVRVEGATEVDAYDDPDYFDLDVDIMPADDCAILLRFEKQEYIAIRVLIEDASAAPEIGILYVGELLPMQRNLYVGHTPANLALNTTIAAGVSEGGSFLGQIEARRTLRTNVQIDNVTPSWYRTTFRPFTLVARTTPFFWAWRPSSYPNEVVFGWTTTDISPTNTLPNGYMSFEFGFEGIYC